MKSKNVRIVAIVLFCLLSIIALAVYNFVIVPEQVATSVNKNIDNLNSNTEEGKKLLTDLSKSLLASESAKNNKFSETLEEINKRNKELEQLAKKTNELANQLDKGPNQDTERFYNTSVEILNKRKESLNNIMKVVSNQICIIQNLNDFTNKLTKSQEYLEQIKDDNIVQSVTLSRQAGQEIDDGGKKLNDLKPCFSGDLQKYYTDELQSDIDKEVKLHSDFAGSLRNLADGVEQNNTVKINEASSKIEILSKQPRVLFEGQNLRKAIDKPTEEFNEEVLKQLEDQKKQFDTIFNEIKQKYNLSAEK